MGLNALESKQSGKSKPTLSAAEFLKLTSQELLALTIFGTAENTTSPKLISSPGGFPCQDISNAGKRAGIDGERSGLWNEYARIIRELRPRYVVVENVAALLVRGIERVLGDLAACGYDAEWQSIRASDVGAPHRRERIWIVAYPNETGPVFQSPSRIHDNGTSRDHTDRCSNDVAYPIEPGLEGHAGNVADGTGWKGQDGPTGTQSLFENVADTDRGRRKQRDSGERGISVFVPRSFPSPQWSVEPGVGRVADGVSGRVDRLRGLGNSIVPQIAQFIGQRIVEHVQ